MLVLIYDGSFDGLLTSVFEIFERKFSDCLIVKEKYHVTQMFAEEIFIATDDQKATRVWQGLSKRLSQAVRTQIYWSFLSELPGIENLILDLIRYSFSTTENIEKNYGHPAVLEIYQTWKKIGREKHRFEAFVRFELIGEKFFYAPVDPDFNVLPLIVPHFKRRYADQNWIIYDTKRKYGMHYDCETELVQETIITFAEGNYQGTTNGIYFDPEEQRYKDLWKNYFKSVNISARKNTKLHIQHVPRRYWKYLVEKN